MGHRTDCLGNEWQAIMKREREKKNRTRTLVCKIRTVGWSNECCAISIPRTIELARRPHTRN